MTAQHERSGVDAVLPAEAKDALKHLDLYARRTVDGFLYGLHQSRRIGVSTDFDHHALYVPGAPLKHVDWKMSARHEKLFVKRYREETALAVWLVVDRSASMLMQSGTSRTKYDCACRVAACLAYLSLKQRDSVGLALASDTGTAWLPIRGASTHLVRILEALVAKPAAGANRTEQAVRAILERGARRGLIVVISDFMEDPTALQARLAALGAMGHEVLLFHLRDETEEEFPFNRWVEFSDLENAAVRHRLDAVTLRNIYLEEYRALMDEWRAWAKKYNAHFVAARTDAAMETVLAEYLVRRGGGQG